MSSSNMKENIKKYIPVSFRQKIKDMVNLFSVLSVKYLPRTKSIDYAGKKLFYRSGMSVMERVFATGKFEPELCESISNNLKGVKHPMVLDIGANIGLITLDILSKFPESKIFCFEPGLIQSRLLKRTIEENDIKNVTVERYAVGDFDGQSDFYVHTGKDSAKDGLVNTGRGEKAEKTTIKIKKLDSWWKENSQPKIDLIKIDTEGAELKVLNGATELLKKESPVIYFELYEKNISAFGIKASEIISLLEGLNYEVKTLEGEITNTANVESLMVKTDSFIATKKN